MSTSKSLEKPPKIRTRQNCPSSLQDNRSVSLTMRTNSPNHIHSTSLTKPRPTTHSLYISTPCSKSHSALQRGGLTTAVAPLRSPR
ncbi:hypothetical protein CISG_01128 [Coccidioides immitis RMSCC 3703]|uniref:Uncharacterized protein n=1 Tax=Coccidioides immitis RMSCC 3703 TaxID=454286 RepID=A0A0J8QYD9_COCIT|nr:hypothetical protein CISG_01128 [Coccidioides immitis RMSCC 3703]